MPVDNSEYLDPDAFSSPIATPQTRTVALILNAAEEFRLDIALHEAAQRYAMKADNIAKLSANEKLVKASAIRAENALSLLNKYRASIGQEPLSAQNILDW